MCRLYRPDKIVAREGLQQVRDAAIARADLNLRQHRLAQAANNELPELEGGELGLFFEQVALAPVMDDGKG